MQCTWESSHATRWRREYFVQRTPTIGLSTTTSSMLRHQQRTTKRKQGKVSHTCLQRAGDDDLSVSSSLKTARRRNIKWLGRPRSYDKTTSHIVWPNKHNHSSVLVLKMADSQRPPFPPPYSPHWPPGTSCRELRTTQVSLAVRDLEAICMYVCT